MGDSEHVILVSNDDGVRSEGIVALAEALKDRQKQLKLDLAESPYRATLRKVKKDLARIKAMLA